MELQRKGLFSCCSFAEGTLPSLALFRDGLMGQDSWTVGLPTGFMSGHALFRDGEGEEFLDHRFTYWVHVWSFQGQTAFLCS